MQKAALLYLAWIKKHFFFDYLNLLCGHPLSSGYGVVNGSVQHQISWLVASRLGLVGVRWIWWKRKYKKRFTLRRKLSGKHHQPTDQEAKFLLRKFVLFCFVSFCFVLEKLFQKENCLKSNFLRNFLEKFFQNKFFAKKIKRN